MMHYLQMAHIKPSVMTHKPTWKAIRDQISGPQIFKESDYICVAFLIVSLGWRTVTFERYYSLYPSTSGSVFHNSLCNRRKPVLKFMEIADPRLKQMFLKLYPKCQKTQIYYPKQEREIGGNGGKDTGKDKRINHYFLYDFGSFKMNHIHLVWWMLRFYNSCIYL